LVRKTNYFIGISKILYRSIFRKENQFFSTLAFAEKTGKMNQQEENRLFERINKSDEKAFEILFHQYYGILCSFASKLIYDDVAAEEIVQDFFVKLWEKREQISIETSVKNYFFRSVKNYSLNFIQHNKTKIAHEQKLLSEVENNFSDDNNYPEPDLFEKIEESINSLPEKRREIFRLSRQEGLKYQEIAQKLNISIKTVETQMSLAIKTLRDKLKNYTTFFSFF
jgi:RNA polymerase sigma-70 factor, ECF subfamily